MSDVGRFNTGGYLANTIWVTDAERRDWSVIDSQRSGADAAGAARQMLDRGELVFRGQCLACHTVDGYRGMRRLLEGRNRQSIDNILKMLHENEESSPYRAFMPPLVGTEPEIDALGAYLTALIGSPDADPPEGVAANSPSGD
jgi:mono/diheme cytochrome c family protein